MREEKDLYARGMARTKPKKGEINMIYSWIINHNSKESSINIFKVNCFDIYVYV